MKRKEEAIDYVKICVNVEAEVWQRFKQFVLEKWGKLKGPLGHELSRALEAYISSQESAHTHTKNMHKSNPKSSNFFKLLNELKDLIELTEDDLKSIVRKNCGLDQRTIKKYTEALESERIIEPKLRVGDRILYAVNHDRLLKTLQHEEELNK